MKYFDLPQRFGFGMMRLPMKGKKVDLPQVCDMVDVFIKNGFNYFDTAHGYIGGQSEIAVRECLTTRYPRDKYVLTNKLSTDFFKCEEDIRPLFESQLKACSVDYFDFYLLHAQTDRLFKKYKRCRAYENAFEFKKEGRVKHVGISFHDRASVLENILNEYPEIEVVQIQYNYVDYNSIVVESKKCLEVCIKHNKPVIIMEPIKGGTLINLPKEAKSLFDNTDISPQNLALRFAANPKDVMMVLSGMSSIEQMMDNISFMKNVKPLTENEQELINKICDIIKKQNIIGCTSCRYCIDGCPKNILIPDIFQAINTKNQFNDWNPGYYYHTVITNHHGKASDCIKCGKCELTCPQKLPIRSLLEEAIKELEKR